MGETVKIVIQALVLALVVRTFLFQPFNIPSGSMEDTLLVGDYLFVSKYAYGYSRFSLPFGPHLFDGRIWSAPPKRGDIVVFKLPRDDRPTTSSGSSACPATRSRCSDGVLYINGKAVPREKIGDSVDACDGVTLHAVPARRCRTASATTRSTASTDGLLDNTQVYEVPPDHYFMMGDNRDNSTDSRVPPTSGGVGYVPFENLVGRAEIIFFSVKEGEPAWPFWHWPWTVRWDRLFKLL